MSSFDKASFVFWISFLHHSMLCMVTWTGNVSSRAISIGTPSSLMLRFGSGEITVRAEKLTRFPERLLRNLPSFPLSRCASVLSGLPDRCRAGGIPEVWLSW